MAKNSRISQLRDRLRLLTALFLICLVTACTKPDPGNAVEPTATDKAMERLKSLYDKARGTNPTDAVDWATDDFKKIGDWEYKIVTISDPDPQAIETQLNELGQQRWEVYWVEQTDQDRRFFLKRTARSYLRAIPLSEIGKILTPDGGE